MHLQATQSQLLLTAHHWLTAPVASQVHTRTLVGSGEVFVQHPLNHGGNVTWQGIPRAGVNILLIHNVMGHASTLEEGEGKGEERRGGEGRGEEGRGRERRGGEGKGEERRGGEGRKQRES